MLKRILFQLSLSIGSILIALLTLELILQGISYQAETIPTPEHRICNGCSYLYEPIPHAGRLNGFGFSGPETTIRKPEGVLRIVVIGDSVSYGSGVEDKETFARILETQLKTGRKIEVINAGVRGYTTYNEVRYLRDQLMQFSPDLVILQTCMNDITNPSWHWNVVSSIQLTPPDDAFPNPELKNQPLPGKNFFEDPIKNSMLYTIGTIAYLKYMNLGIEKDVGVIQNGKFWPTYITAESELTLLPYLNYLSPEWVWLRKQLDIGVQITKEKQVPFMLLVVPLAFELDENYPYDPDRNFMRYCEESGIPCLNLLKDFKGRDPKEFFIMRAGSRFPNLADVWHFNRNGHRVTADSIAHYLKSRDLLPR